MGSTAVWMASEQHLKELGLSERGYIICLKNFCIPLNEKSGDRKKSLVAAVTQGGKDRVNKKSIYKKTVTLGWMHYDRKDKTYKTVRTRKGGGTRQCQFLNTGTYDDILSKATDLFFSGGKNLYGHSDIMDLNLGNYKGEIISKENFSVQKYIVDHRLSKTRIYLMSKLKSNNQLVKEIANTTISINSDIDDDFEIPSPFLQSNSINPDDFLNISGHSSQTIASIPSLNQTNVAEYGSSYT